MILVISLKLIYSILKEETKIFPFCSENEIFPKDNYNHYMKR